MIPEYWSEPIAGDGVIFYIRPYAPWGHRWVAEDDSGKVTPITLRNVCGALEDYEPAHKLTAVAVANGERMGTVANELREQCNTPIVLVRRLREVALEVMAAKGLTLSDVAVGCGRVRRNGSAETTWLKRRLGIDSEPRGSAPSRWIHTDVLALIARDGLGVAPMDVELGWDLDYGDAPPRLWLPRHTAAA